MGMGGRSVGRLGVKGGLTTLVCVDAPVINVHFGHNHAGKQVLSLHAH